MEMKKYNKPDLYAPRFMIKKFDILKLKNKKFYISMKKQYPELEKYTNSEIRRCIEFMNERISKEVLTNRTGVSLPYGLGIILVGACKLKDNIIDNPLSGEVGVAVANSNLHSDTLVAKVKYSNYLESHLFDNNHMWEFKPCRKLSRAVSAEFKKGNHGNYITFDPFQRVSTLFRKPKISEEKKSKAKENSLDDYDEFAF